MKASVSRSIDASLYPSKLDVVFKSFWKYIGPEILRLVRFLPAKTYLRFRKYTTARGRRDQCSPTGQLCGGSGQSTYANRTLRPNFYDPSGWTRYDVVHVDMVLLGTFKTQVLAEKIRGEIMAARGNVTARGDDDLSAVDLEGMPVLNAALKIVAGGLRACIGWRFSVLEQQALAAMLMENFEFSLPQEGTAKDVKRKPSLVMLPIIDDQPGSTLLLEVKPLQ
ncbi:hypothetical protein EVG20_g5624 [Dentipellis fragilis]|uniref:Uncharacterized protein n=1 Tax=Dentipellis fragilis TaxID=205917 RepID=A0A4Y9YSK1_9AGAM|nr:hypothetical protein EVG20_g5624 [Dentipellis fragilis]